MTPLSVTVECLEARGIRYALIGANALAAQGYARATRDVDLLVTSQMALEDRTWEALRVLGIVVEISPGDAFDPLGGVVRVDPDGAMPIDVVVGHSYRWQDPLLERAQSTITSALGPPLPIVGAADLVLLKLYAGGPRDIQDVHALLDLAQGAQTAAQVTQRVALLPQPGRALWQRIQATRAD